MASLQACPLHQPSSGGGTEARLVVARGAKTGCEPATGACGSASTTTKLWIHAHTFEAPDHRAEVMGCCPPGEAVTVGELFRHPAGCAGSPS
jgi:hypothetical protein